MIDKELLSQVIKHSIEGSGLFLVDLRVSPSNEICVEIDSSDGVDIDACARLTHDIEAVFDRNEEDYELEVGSSGLTTPFKVQAQYAKNIGNDIEVLTNDGRKLRGTLVSVAGDNALDKDVHFTVGIQVKVKEPGAKRPVMRQENLELDSRDCKYVRYDLKF